MNPYMNTPDGPNYLPVTAIVDGVMYQVEATVTEHGLAEHYDGVWDIHYDPEFTFEGYDYEGNQLTFSAKEIINMTNEATDTYWSLAR